jgi:hypothetical protein
MRLFDSVLFIWLSPGQGWSICFSSQVSCISLLVAISFWDHLEVLVVASQSRTFSQYSESAGRLQMESMWTIFAGILKPPPWTRNQYIPLLLERGWSWKYIAVGMRCDHPALISCNAMIMAVCQEVQGLVTNFGTDSWESCLKAHLSRRSLKDGVHVDVSSSYPTEWVLTRWCWLMWYRPFLVNELKLQHLLHDRRKVYAVSIILTCIFCSFLCCMLHHVA